MESSIPRHPLHNDVHVVVEQAALVCHKTLAGSWLCCTEEGASSCARGLTLDNAVANWEKAQELAD